MARRGGLAPDARDLEAPSKWRCRIPRLGPGHCRGASKHERVGKLRPGLGAGWTGLEPTTVGSHELSESAATMRTLWRVRLLPSSRSHSGTMMGRNTAATRLDATASPTNERAIGQGSALRELRVPTGCFDPPASPVRGATALARRSPRCHASARCAPPSSLLPLPRPVAVAERMSI